MIRAALIACVVIVAAAVTPEMLRPGINSADLIVIFSPAAVLWIGSWRIRKEARETAVSNYYRKEP